MMFNVGRTDDLYSMFSLMVARRHKQLVLHTLSAERGVSCHNATTGEAATLNTSLPESSSDQARARMNLIGSFSTELLHA